MTSVFPPTTGTVTAAARQGGIGLYEWNPVDQVLLWDDTLAGIFGADRPDELPFQTWRRRTHPDDQARVIETFSEFREAEDLYRLVMDDGGVRYVLSRATQVVVDEAGTPVKLVGVMIDVTTAHEASARLTDMLESISDGFAALDGAYRFTYLNPQAESILGLSREQLLGRVLWDVFPDALGTTFESAYTRVLQEQVPQRFVEYYPEPLNIWIEVNAQPADGGLVLYFQDVTERRRQEQDREALLQREQQAHAEADAARLVAEEAQRALAHQASHDGLTGLLNRSELTARATSLLADRRSMTLVFVDLDRFKLVNDSLGHAAGDELLVQVARRLTAAVRPGEVVARLGGDEFVVLLPEVGLADAEAVAGRLLDTLQEPMHVRGSALPVTASIGIAQATGDQSFETLLRDADVALYRAKDAGRNQIAWFDAQAHADLLDRIALEADLRDALDADALQVHYQPVLSLPDRRTTGVEALVRWEHPTRGWVPPSSFVPLAEDAGLVDRLGAAVLRQACAQAAAWAHVPDFRVWVNVSPRQLERPGLAEGVLACLAEAGVPPWRLGVEVTESALGDEHAVTAEVSALAAAGVGIAIDDFGTGYSSLARLTSLPIAVLKIDRSFVRDVVTPRGRAAVNAVVHLAQALGLETIAEGIETEEELRLVAEAGSTAAAGYLLGRPVPAAELQLPVRVPRARTPQQGAAVQPA